MNGGFLSEPRRFVRHLVLSAVASAALAASAVPSQSQTLASLPTAPLRGLMEPTGIARPVQAWLKFCDRYPSECDVRTTDIAVVPASAKLLRTLNAVNRQVNAAIKPRTDMDHWGVVDRWDFPEDGFGDCEDYQLLKRRILVEQHGLSKRAMRMTVVIDDQGEGHAVLMVRTDEGELILDNKRSAVLPWNETGYIYVKREGQDGREWVSLGDRSSPVTTANR